MAQGLPRRDESALTLRPSFLWLSKKHLVVFVGEETLQVAGREHSKIIALRVLSTNAKPTRLMADLFVYNVQQTSADSKGGIACVFVCVVFLEMSGVSVYRFSSEYDDLDSRCVGLVACAAPAVILVRTRILTYTRT